MTRVLAALLALVVLLATGSWRTHDAPAATSASTTTESSDASRAEASFAALERAFGTSGGSGLYRERYPYELTDHPYSYEWPFSQVHAAVGELAQLPNGAGASYDAALGRSDLAQLHYWAAHPTGGHAGFEASAQPPYGTGGIVYYDDNEWVGLEAIQEYAQSRSASMLAQAQEVFDLAVAGWDTDPSHARPGGVFWMQSQRNTNRCTVSNMPAAELGLRLYQATGRLPDLLWARRMYTWTNRNLQRPDGLYYDHVDLAGDVDQSMWTYNQGVPIEVDLLLYRITGDRSYLDEAGRIASAAYQFFITGHLLQSQPIAFNAIFFKALLTLEAETGGTTYRTAIQAFANRLWDDARDPTTGVFRFSSGGGRTDLVEQAAATQIFAMLALSHRALINLA